jgi:predicted lipoprotein with Yx(FWY)xxD motif
VEVDLHALRHDDGIVYIEACTNELREAPAEYRRRLGNIERSEPAKRSCGSVAPTLPGVRHVTLGTLARLIDMLVRGKLATLAILSLAAGQAAAAGGAVSTITAGHSTYGVVLFDAHGKVLYAFTRDPRGQSTCSGACAAAWPPYVVDGAPRAGAGTRRALLGTTRRPDGRRQLTYAGRPLYYYVGDHKPGQILCQDVVEFGGRWLVIRPNGRLVR